MHFISSASDAGINERGFTLGEITGVLWTPADPADSADHAARSVTRPRPLVLIGHGGGRHKKHASVLGRARRCVLELGFAAAAIDMPGHGDRPRGEEDGRLIAALRARHEAGQSADVEVRDLNRWLAEHAVPEWKSVLDELLALPEVGADGPAVPVGYWGVSLGGAVGVQLAASEPRITAAVLGLTGMESAGDSAPWMTAPVRFLLQWDDALVPHDSALALYDALGSAEKSLHANQGGHADIPESEHDDSLRFLERHLTRERTERPYGPVAPDAQPLLSR